MKTPTLIFCAAGNKYYAEIAKLYGLELGARLDKPSTKVYFKPYFADQDYARPRDAAKKACWGISDPDEREKVYQEAYLKEADAMRVDYMAALALHRPRIATVLDLEAPWQFDAVVAWVKEARQYVETVIIIPKYSGAIAQLVAMFGMDDWIAGYSVKTSYGETTVPIEEFAGLKVHLLGGNPDTQYELAPRFNTVSVDCNMHMQHAQRNCFFSNTRTRAKNKSWPMLKESMYGHVEDDTNRLAFTLSCMNIRALWAGCQATVRFAVERDIPQIIAIARQYRNELGYVNPMALREGIPFKENDEDSDNSTRKTFEDRMMGRVLLVASHNSEAQRAYSDTLVSPGSEKILGFVNYRARRDGVQVVYEIGVHQDWKGQHIGAGLLSAVPSPIRLKCTTENPANAFYEAQGFVHDGIDKGKKRPLNIWHRGNMPPVKPIPFLGVSSSHIQHTPHEG